MKARHRTTVPKKASARTATRKQAANRREPASAERLRRPAPAEPARPPVEVSRPVKATRRAVRLVISRPRRPRLRSTERAAARLAGRDTRLQGEPAPIANEALGAPGGTGVRPVAPSLAESGNLLSSYFQMLGAHPPLSAEDERRAVLQIERLEIDAWAQALSFAPATIWVLDQLAPSLPVRAPALAALRRAAREAQRTRSKAARLHLGRAAMRAAGELRALDLDHERFERLLVELRARARDASRPGPLSGADPGFRTYVEDVVRASAAAVDARNAFLCANLRLVVAIARRYRRDLMPLIDMIEEGNLGLMKGLARYDHRRGVKFSTYASWWIRHSIGRALADQGREIRLPVHIIEKRRHISHAVHKLSGQLGRQPTSEELARETGIAKARIESIHGYHGDQLVSLDQQIHDNDDQSLIDIFRVPEQEERSPLDGLIKRQQIAQVAHLLGAGLSPMESSVLRWRFGLVDGTEHTLSEIGEKYNLSRERIRQIEAAALLRLRRQLTHTEGQLQPPSLS